MSRDNCLPFERGSTLYEGDTAAIAADSAGNLGLEGKKFLVHEGSRELILMVVKADATLTTPAGVGMRYTADYGDRRVAGPVNTLGQYGHIADPDLTGNVASGDYFYVCVEGFAADAVLGASNSTDLGVAIFNNAGQLIPISTNDAVHVVGRFTEAVTSTGAGNERVDVLIGGSAADYYGT